MPLCLYAFQICVICVICGSFAFAQTPALTNVKDTVYKSDGTLFTGTMVITWPAFVSADSKAILGGTKTLTLTSGALSVSLIPNAGGSPSGTSYAVTASQSGGITFKETWVVIASSPLVDPAIPVSVTQAGAAGTTTYYYWCTATNANGETLLSPAKSTATSNATLSVTNYNIILCATVASATGYKAYRTTTSTAPTGTGLYLVGSSATTTINDQSNTLTSATIPALNTTDPKTLAQVRVLGVPSPAVSVTAAQVVGTAIVASPSATQIIPAPAVAATIPLALKGNTTANADVLDIYDSAATPVKQSFFDSGGKLNTAKQIISTLATGTAPFSVASTTQVTNLQAATAGALAATPTGCAANQYALSIAASGNLGCAQVAFSQITGVATLAQLPFNVANQILGANAGGTAQEHKTLAVGTTGTDFAIAHAANSITFNLPDASATARGAVTTGTQTIAGAKTFSSAPTLSTMTLGSIPFFGAAGLLSQDNANLFWDNTNKALGIGTAAPGFKLDVNGNVIAVGAKVASSGAGGNIRFRDDLGTTRWLTGIGGQAAQTTWVLYDLANSKQPITVEASAPDNAVYIKATTGNVGIGTASPSSLFSVGLTSQFQVSSSGTVSTTGGILGQKAVTAGLAAVTFSATPAFDASAGNVQKMTLTANVTSSTITNAPAANTSQPLTLLLCQDATGSRTMAWPANLKLAGGAYTLTTTASKCDTLTAVYDGTNWYETGRAGNE